MIRKITTVFTGGVPFQEEPLNFTRNEDKENQLVTIYPDKKYQTVLGFGGAFTEAGGYALSKLSAEKRREAIAQYFSDSGLRYSFCRTHVNSCDFALDNYCYVEENDISLHTFSIKRDEEYLLPFISDAAEISTNGFRLLASPWSPPPFMKTNGQMNGGGKLKKEYRELWAEYLAKYILAYREKGIDITVLSVQNEPKAVQKWDSCVYTAEEELDFAVNYLHPALKRHGLGTKILLWDHNKERVYERAKVYFAEPNDALWGVGFHWYSGDHFEAVQMTYEDYPDKCLIFTEGCVEYSRFEKDAIAVQAEMYAHDMIGNFNAGTSAFIDWNMFLDENGGPNHVNNFCAAPVMCDTQGGNFRVNPSYYAIGHFSKYVRPGAKRIGFTKYTDKLEAAVFENPNGERVVILLNRTGGILPFTLKSGTAICPSELPAHSMATLLFSREEEEDVL